LVTQRAVSRRAGPAQRLFSAVLIAFALIASTVSYAAAEIPNLRKYAGIVVDAKSGRVLYEDQADSRRYPASVTKVMTLYILFQELKAGNLKLNTMMTVSAHAAAAVPTKLGVRAGGKISVENAIRSMVTLSANDMARVVAETISGSESKFAERMTATARALGMRNTVYRNASGLPDSNQTTTVRDQALLGIAVYQHFPEYYDYFQTRSFTYNKRTYGNHNPLLGTNGIDGIKTGYINAAGSNLLTASRKDNKHIVVVAFGFNTASARNNKVAELVRTYLPKARAGGYLEIAQIPLPGRSGGNVQVAVSPPRPVVPMAIPSFRLASLAASEIEVATPVPLAAPLPPPVPFAEPVQVIVAGLPAPVPQQRPVDLLDQPALQAATRLAAPPPQGDAPIDVIGAWIDQTFKLGPTSGAQFPSSGQAPLLPPVGVGDNNRAVDLLTSGSIATVASAAPQTQEFGIIPGPQPVVTPLAAAPVSAPAPAPIGWVVQIGAAPSQDGAEGLLATATDKIDRLGGFQSYVERFDKNGQTYFRARFSGFGDRDDATSMCETIKRADMSCLAIQG
jgi:D-alanyl-D-alanine carboxypeptidase